MAARLAHALQTPIEWRALGLTGASVAQLRAEVLPRRHVDPDARVEAAVIVCGVNGWKRAWWRLPLLYGPRAFGRHLAALVEGVREATGNGRCRV